MSKNVIIIPTYNEKESIEILIPLIFQTLPEIRVVVVDDNSPDGTADVVTRLQKKYSDLVLMRGEKKSGLGQAYLRAFSAVLRDQEVRAVIMMDADLSHQPKYLPEMIRRSETYGVVVGSRYIDGGGTAGWDIWRKILSFCGNFYCRLITGVPVHDCTGGFNVISTDLLRKVNFSDLDMTGYAFIMQLKYLLFVKGATFFEVPIVFNNRLQGESKISGHIISEGIIAPWKMIFRPYR